jgi:hypothetical protein
LLTQLDRFGTGICCQNLESPTLHHHAEHLELCTAVIHQKDSLDCTSQFCPAFDSLGLQRTSFP